MTKKGNSTTWVAFYENYRNYVRRFALEHPSLTYVEIPLDSNTGYELEQRTGIQRECWGHSNTGKWRKDGGGDGDAEENEEEESDDETENDDDTTTENKQ